jgi:hypothetical protein
MGKPPPAAKRDLAAASLHYDCALPALRADDWSQFAEMLKMGADLGQPSDSVHH